MVVLGVSPRGALAVCQMAKAFAFVKGREYVAPEDVAAVLVDVCAHRLVLSPKARMTENSAVDVISEIIGLVKMPIV
jgi:MoxR-like ATPase